MRAQQLAGSARGGTVDLDLSDPLTVIVGPTGAGKTTALQGLVWVLTGAFDSGHRRSRSAADVAAALGKPVLAVTFDDGTALSRSITGTTERVGLRGKDYSRSAGQAAIIEWLGDVSAIDMGALLAMGPTDRRNRLLDLCRDASGWTIERVGEELESVLGSLAPAWDVEDGELLLDAVRRHADEANRTVNNVRARLRNVAADIEQLGGELPEDAPSAEALKEQRAALREKRDGILAELQQYRDRSAVQADYSRLEQVAGELEARRAAAEEAEAAAAEAMQRLNEYDAEVIPAATTAANAASAARDEASFALDVEQGALSEAREAVAVARAKADAINGRGPGFDGVCPTCTQPVPQEVSARLFAEQEAAEAAFRSAREALMSRERAYAIAADAETKAAQAAAKASLYLTQAESEARDLRLRVAQGGILLERAAAAAHRVREAEEAKRSLTTRKAPAADDALQVERLEAAQAQVDGELADVDQQLVAALDADGAGRRLDKAVARRGELDGELQIAKSVAAAWSDLAAKFGEEAVAPFASMTTECLPDGWSARVDMAEARIFIQRPKLPEVAAEYLSNGETAIFCTAAACAIAKLSGGYRLVTLDHAEQIGKGPLVEVVARLADALERGWIDQAVVATARLEAAEKKTLPLGTRVVSFKAK